MENVRLLWQFVDVLWLFIFPMLHFAGAKCSTDGFHGQSQCGCYSWRCPYRRRSWLKAQITPLTQSSQY